MQGKEYLLWRAMVMLERWIPWKFLAKRILRSYGFMDPFSFLARLRRFSQPSEVQEPIELLRAGIVFHTRGLINTKAIQNNLDWVWPFWVEKQFNPDDPSFLPRAYSLTHVNLTQRNWTAVGLPDLPLYPIVDPRGLITPCYDGWSLDFWITGEDTDDLLPSKQLRADQALEMETNLVVRTRCGDMDRELVSRLWLERREGVPSVIIKVEGRSNEKGFLAASLRPYNPEGIQFIENISYDGESRSWLVNRETTVNMDRVPEKVLFSNYEQGDVLHRLKETSAEAHIDCRVGMATSSALFSLEENRPRLITLCIPLEKELEGHFLPPPDTASDWRDSLNGTARLKIPDSRISFLYDAAVRTLVLLSASEVFPGPYTYRRFWFRDACLMVNSLLSLGLKERSRRLLDSFPSRQDHSGYFRSQEGEWDSNGQVLWIFDRFQRLTGKSLPEAWTASALKGAEWVTRKRTPKEEGEHGGLLPAGFSAEHLGPNDFYYWDDFWGLAGLKAAARIAARFRSRQEGQAILQEAADFEETIFDSIARIPDRRRRGGIPASPYRRMDSGAVGSLAADYPLQITPAGDQAVAGTVAFLMEHCFHAGGFFQDMIHSGINAYLTLCIAQTLLRQGDSRYRDLVERVADLASPTGQWPEAIHPLTGGGCMGDGQHGWAAAEWVQMVRSLFVREEEDLLVLGSGIFDRWIRSGEDLAFGPTPTPVGDVTVRVFQEKGRHALALDADWRGDPPKMEIRIPGFRRIPMDSHNQPQVLEPLLS
jgi:hypothetical protein